MVTFTCNLTIKRNSIVSLNISGPLTFNFTPEILKKVVKSRSLTPGLLFTQPSDHCQFTMETGELLFNVHFPVSRSTLKTVLTLMLPVD